MTTPTKIVLSAWTLWIVWLLACLSGCDISTDNAADTGVDGATVHRGASDGAQKDARDLGRPTDVDCSPTCRLGADGVSCLCVDDFGRDVYCRDVAPAGIYWHSCCGRACY